MPVLAPVAGGRLTGFNGSSGGPSGLASTYFFETKGRGIPRRENLLGIRILEKTHAVQIPLQAIKAQVSATPWMIRTPEGIEGSDLHKEAAAEIEEWLDGHYNANGDPFVALVKSVLGDILAIDAGVIELVPDEAGYVREMYVRDGITFTKAPDKHGRLPPSGDAHPAYWQFSLAGAYGFLERNDAILDALRDEFASAGLMRPFNPVPFSRDQLVWIEENPRSWDVYGFGRLQIVRRVLEIILNQDVVNKKYFTTNEVPEGLLQFIDANKDEIDRFRHYWNTDIKGKEHKLPIVGGKQAQYLPFRASLADLQFLESQKWYHKLVWFVMGVSGPEVGETESVNLANGQEQAVSVWRRTTRPLLELLAQTLNRKVLPFLEAYHRVAGELEFAWDYDNPAIQALRRTRENEDLEKGTLTINEVRRSRGQEPLPWGEMGSEDKREIVRKYPKWALENWFGVEADDLPEDSGGDFGDPFALSTDPGHGDLPPVDFASMTVAHVKEALRNEPGHKYPAVAAIVNEAADEVAAVLQHLQDDVLRGIESSFPKKAVSFDISAILANVDVSDSLRRIATQAGLKAMKASAKFHAERAEEELRARLPKDSPDVTFQFSVEDTFAAKNMAQRAAQRMRTVSETIKRLIRDTLVGVVSEGRGNVSDATKALRTLFDDHLTTNHARLVARTEVLMASRSGAQAFAESTDLIAGKRWRATKDNRTRPWHRAMDGVIVPKDSVFTVAVVDRRQANRGYPKSVFVVGDDEPYNCRCDQEPVLRDDLPANLRGLGRGHGLVRKHAPTFTDGLTDKQYDVLFAEGAPGEDFQGMLRRLDAAAGNRKALAERLDVGRATLYEWLGDTSPVTE